MKKLILLLSVITLSYSCSSDSNNSSNNNGNSFTNSMDYEFTITINGEVHKVKGNTADGIPFGTVNSGTHTINNQCTVYNSSGKLATLEINDVTATNYISGQNISCSISFSNLLIGINQVQVMFFGSYFDTLETNLGGITEVNNLLRYQTVIGPQNTNFQFKLPINITDLGTGTLYPQLYPLPLYNFGETLKGNYSGTIYIQRQIATSPYIIYDIPVQLSIDFKALRTY